ncbi:MAG TPA: hypothetical protein VJM31_14195 [Vicinamibacterales bacterium]|nr:hypothetical protein [Vicinamibacterales bacterium]
MPYLIVGIDTEGDNQWEATSRLTPTYENIYALPRLHELLQRSGTRPVYLITHPVAVDARSAATLGALAAGGDCEIGSHHHVWETPPCDPEDAEGLPYALQLSHDRFKQQLAILTNAVKKTAGDAPVSYRSGRFGFHASHTAALEEAGYTVDSSVQPLFYETHKGGPDFVDAPLTPYWLSYASAVQPGNSSLLEVPVSAALNRRLPAWLVRAYGRAPQPYQTKRALRLLRVVKTVWLRPSYSSLEDMKTFARRLVDEGEPVLNVIFHSSEAIVGGSPYNKTEGELEGFFDRLQGFLTYAIRDLGAQAVTLREFHAAWARVNPARPSRER